MFCTDVRGYVLCKKNINIFTLSVICHDRDPSARLFFSHSITTMPRIWSRLAHTSLMVCDTLDSWHKLKLSRKLATCCKISKGRELNWSHLESKYRFFLGWFSLLFRGRLGRTPKEPRCLSWMIWKPWTEGQKRL